MPFEPIIEALIQEAMQRGEFDNLSGEGRPIDLSDYFNTPQDLRLAYSMLKNARLLPREAELLQELAELRQEEALTRDEEKRRALRRQIEHKHIELSLRLERLCRSGNRR